MTTVTVVTVVTLVTVDRNKHVCTILQKFISEIDIRWPWLLNIYELVTAGAVVS